MNILYIEPFSGLSGDMFLGALCGLLDDYEGIAALPERLKLHDGRVEIAPAEKNGIVCRHVNVVDTNAHADAPDHQHSHGGHSHGSHGGSHRHLSDIVKIIEGADIDDDAKRIAKEIFRLIGEAESKVHNIPIEKIHFHEISAVDSIIDIVGCATLISKLQISKTYCDPICVGFGMVDTQHGLLPVPAPATARLLYGMPTYKGNEEGERVTPTGAAILRYLEPDFQPPRLAVEKSAYGPGQKDFIAPNVLRLSLASDSRSADSIFAVETNLDDCSPELVGMEFQNRLMEAGALDFTLTQALMKKGRPGFRLGALVGHSDLDAVCDAILEHTTAIGVRYYPVERKTLDRSQQSVKTEYGDIKVKTVTTPSGSERSKLEDDDLQKASREHGLPVNELRRRIDAD